MLQEAQDEKMNSNGYFVQLTIEYDNKCYKV